MKSFPKLVVMCFAMVALAVLGLNVCEVNAQDAVDTTEEVSASTDTLESLVTPAPSDEATTSDQSDASSTQTQADDTPAPTPEIADDTGMAETTPTPQADIEPVIKDATPTPEVYVTPTPAVDDEANVDVADVDNDAAADADDDKFDFNGLWGLLGLIGLAGLLGKNRKEVVVDETPKYTLDNDRTPPPNI